MIRWDYSRQWQQDERFYAKMKGRHARLWEFLEAFIHKHHPKKILEIGGGSGEVGAWCPGTYVCVDRNPHMCQIGRELYKGNKATFICDDFMSMDARQFQSTNFGLVLAASVIEHCSGFGGFIHRTLDVNADIILITFFRSLLWKEERVALNLTPEAIFYENRYMGEHLVGWLDDRNINYQLHFIKNKVSDVILFIDTHGSRMERITEIVESINLTDPGWGQEQKEKVIAERTEKYRDDITPSMPETSVGEDNGEKEE